MNITNLKIGTRLAVGFGAVCAALVFMVGQGTVMLGKINEGTDEIVNKRMPRIDAPTRMLSEVNDVAIALRNMMLNDEASDRAAQVEKIASSRKAVDAIFQQMEGMFQDPKARAVLDKQHESSARYMKGTDDLLRLIAGGDAKAANTFLMKELRPALRALKDATAEQIQIQKDLATAKAHEAQETYERTRNLMLVLGLVILAAAAALARWITLSITRPVRQALDVANAVASGDLTSRVDARGDCEVAQLLKALKSMNEQLVVTVGTVRSSTDAIATASSQVAAGNLDLSSRTEQQAGSLEETASSMEELTSTVKQNADNARQANTLAETAAGVAARGGQVIHEVVQTMDQIHTASGKIVDIISVIDGIAFQTNILALNAAVEAARAGEQGRGFAVVAGEVRNLAQRSAAAAKEIKTLIGDSSEKVETGSRLVDQAGSTMDEVVGSVKRVTDIISEIAAASDEQRVGIEQVNGAIVQMDQVTQQNAALVEQAAAAADAMQEQAQQLSQLVGTFQTGQGAAPALAPARESTGAGMQRVRAAAARPARVALPVRAGSSAGREPAVAGDDWESF